MTHNGFTGRYDEPWVQELIDDTGRMAKATIVDFLIGPEPAKLDMVIAAVECLAIDELMVLAPWAGVEPWNRMKR